jgi:small subunit ribosomal protein S1
MSWSTHFTFCSRFRKVGDVVEAVILTFRDDRKMSLGIKQLSQDPWTDITSKYPVGSKHSGIVRNFTNFGILELEEGIDGLIYISDLSWTKKIKHPSEFVNVGKRCSSIRIDVDGRKLSLGHKQTTLILGINTKVHLLLELSTQVKSLRLLTKNCIWRRYRCFYLVTLKEDGKKLKKRESDFSNRIQQRIQRVVASHTALP